MFESRRRHHLPWLPFTGSKCTQASGFPHVPCRASEWLHATELAGDGVLRINISVDTRNPVNFKAITRWGDIAKVEAGLAAAKAASLVAPCERDGARTPRRGSNRN